MASDGLDGCTEALGQGRWGPVARPRGVVGRPGRRSGTVLLKLFVYASFHSLGSGRRPAPPSSVRTAGRRTKHRRSPG